MYFVDSDTLLNKSLEELNVSLSKENFIAVDTEFIRENYIDPFLCLVQIASADNVYLFDPLKIDIKKLDPIFSQEKFLKIFHSARQDLEALSFAGIHVKNFYDTQLNEMLLDTKENVNYAFLVQKYLGIKIKKDSSRSNWKARPLGRKQIKYAVNDVLYLRKVFKKQFEKLQEMGRENWLFDFSFEKFEKEEIPNKNIYDTLKAWCEEKSLLYGILPQEIVNLDVIKSICKKGISYINGIKNSRGEKKKELLEFLTFAEKFASQIKIPEEKEIDHGVLKLLESLLMYSSDTYNISSKVIASKKDLIEFLDVKEKSKLLFGWKKDIFGKYALKLLCGELNLKVENGKMKIVHEKFENVLAVSASLKHLSLALKYTRKNKVNDSYFLLKTFDEDINVSSELVNYVKKFLEKIDNYNLDAIVCASGPGSFTGIRAMQSFVKAFSLVTNTKSIGIEYFDVIRRIFKNRFQENFKIEVITIKSEKDQIYFKIFDNNEQIECGISDFQNLKKILSRFEKVVLIGEMVEEIKNFMPEIVLKIFKILDFREAKYFIEFADQNFDVIPLYINARMSNSI